jgi:MFS family permease
MTILEELRRGWRIIAGSLLGIAFGVTGLFFYSAGVFLKPISAEFGWTRTAISSVNLVAALTLAGTAPLVGWLVDRFGVRAIVVASNCGLACGFLLLSTSQGSFPAYLALIALTLLLGAGAAPVVFTRLVNLWFDRGRGTALGLAQMATGIAGAVIPPLLAPYVEQNGWRNGYHALAVVALASMPVVLLLLGRSTERSPTSTTGSPMPLPGLTLQEAVRTSAFRALALMIACAAIAVGGVIVHLVPMLTDAGLTPERAGGIAGLLGLAIIVGRAATGMIVDRVFAPRVAFVIFLVSAGGCWLLAWGGVAWAAPAAILVGLAMGAEVDLISYFVARYFGLAHYGRIYGWFYAVFMFGTAAGPLIAGAAFDRYGDYSAALVVLGAALAAASVLSWWLRPFPRFEAPAAPSA